MGDRCSLYMLQSLQTALLLLLFVPFSSHASCTKIMRWDQDAPFTFVSPDAPDKVQGISVDVARVAMRRLGCSLTLKRMPWARALKELQQGHIDLISGAYRTPERETYANFSTEGIQSPNVLFVRDDELSKWHFTRLEDLQGSGFRLGGQIGVSYSPEYDQLLKKDWFTGSLILVSDRLALWKMLARKRIDGVIADEMTGRLELKRLNLNTVIHQTSTIVSDDPAFYAFSKATTGKAFVAGFDRAIHSMRQDGTFQAIIDKYLK